MTEPAWREAHDDNLRFIRAYIAQLCPDAKGALAEELWRVMPQELEQAWFARSTSSGYVTSVAPATPTHLAVASMPNDLVGRLVTSGGNVVLANDQL